MGQIRFFSLSEATSLGEGNSEFKLFKLRLKIDLVSYSARAEGLGKYDIYEKYTLAFQKQLKYITKLRQKHISTTSDAFAVVVKVRKHTGQ